MLTITIHQTSPSRYAATFNGRVLVESSRIPLLDSARILLAEGHDPTTILAMRRATSPTIAMSGRLDRLADLTVRDDDRGLRFEPYRPHPAELPDAVPPEGRQRPTPAGSSAASSEPSKPILEPDFT